MTGPKPHTPAESGPPPRIDLDRLGRLIGDPGLLWLVERVRRRMERDEPLTGPRLTLAPTAWATFLPYAAEH